MSAEVDSSDVVQHLRSREMSAYTTWLRSRGQAESDRLYDLWLKALRSWLDERDAREAKLSDPRPAQ